MIALRRPCQLPSITRHPAIGPIPFVTLSHRPTVRWMIDSPPNCATIPAISRGAPRPPSLRTLQGAIMFGKRSAVLLVLTVALVLVLVPGAGTQPPDPEPPGKPEQQCLKDLEETLRHTQ